MLMAIAPSWPNAISARKVGRLEVAEETTHEGFIVSAAYATICIVSDALTVVGFESMSR